MSQRKYGVLLSYLSIAIGLVIGLLFTPFLIHSLGKLEYGLFSIVGALAAYMMLMDLGLNDAVVRYIGKCRAKNDTQGEENVLATMLIIYSCLSVFVVLCGWAVYENLPLIFGEDFGESEMHSLRLMFLIFLVNVAVTILFNPIGATIIAYERFIFLRTLEIISHVGSTAALIVFLLMGYKAVGVVSVMVAVSLSLLFIKILYAFIKIKIRIKLHKLSFDFIMEIFRYAAPIFIVVIVEQIYWKLDNIILGSMLGPTVVAVYAIGILFQKYFLSFTTAISKVMLPKIIQRIELGADAKELTDILIKISRIQAIVILLTLSGLVLFGKDFIVLWVGSEYIMAYYVILATLIPFSIELIGNFRNTILQVTGYYWYKSAALLVISLFNIALTIFLVNRIGMIGAAISTGIGILIGYVFVSFVLRYKLEIDTMRYFKEVSSGILPAVCIAAFIGFLIGRYEGVTWTAFFVKAILFTSVYFFLIWLIGMNKNEKEMVRSLLPAKLLKQN